MKHVFLGEKVEPQEQRSEFKYAELDLSMKIIKTFDTVKEIKKNLFNPIDDFKWNEMKESFVAGMDRWNS